MLFALLPFTAWAATEEPAYPVDLSSGWVIQFVSGDAPGTPLATPTAIYNGSSVAPKIRLYDEANDKYIPESKLNVSWSPSPVVDVNGGTAYVVTVTGNTQYTYDELPANARTKKFFVLTAENGYVAGKAPLIHGNFTYNGTETPVITNEPEAKFGTILYSVNGGEWSSTIPTAKWPGEYVVKVKVIGTDNYAGINENESATLGTLTIAGLAITSYTAPTIKSNMDFVWDDNANEAKPQELVNEGSVDLVEQTIVPGVMKYAFAADGPWSADIPKKAHVGTYEVFWKIEGQGGYADVAGGSLGSVKILAIEPTITSVATGKTGLVYGGDGSDEVALLSGAAVVEDGAIAKYKTEFKAPGSNTYGTQSAAKAFADVKGKNAGTYRITTLVETYDDYTTVTSPTTIEVTIAQADAFKSVPTAKENLVWDYNNAVVNQVLINAAGGAVSGKVQYAINPATEADWKTNVNDIKANRAQDYVVKYRVVDPNYKAVAATAIAGAKIARKVVSVIVNDVTKTYNNSLELASTTVDNGGTDRFTFATLLPGTTAAFAGFNTVATSANNYVTLTDNTYKNYKAGGYADVVTIDPTVGGGLDAVATAQGFDYEFHVVPGKLTVNQAEITVTENGTEAQLTTMFGVHKDISNLYTVTPAATSFAGEDPWKVVSGQAQKPVLKSEADDVEGEPEAGNYALYFAPGTLKSNYKMSTAGANHDGYVIAAGHKFVITPDPARKVIITVLPHTQKYTGVAESWANIEKGTDYIVSGLIPGDDVTGVTFTRANDNKFDADIYTLSADNATIVKDGTPVDMAAKYPGGIVYTASTFTIQPIELTATVAQQTVKKGASALPTALPYADAWTVEGMVNGETKADLGGTLAINTTEGSDPAANVVDFYDTGIKLTITNTNYTLKAGTQYGTLRVIDAASTIELDPTNAELAELIEANKYVPADDNLYDVTFAHKALKANTWYTMVLPFEVKTAELVASLKAGAGTTADPTHSVYAIVNRMNESTTADKINFTLEMLSIPANEPFLIKTAEDVNMQDVTFADKKIIFTDDPSIAYGGNEFIGTYTAVTNLPEIYNTTDKHYAFLATGHKGSKGQTLANTWWNANLAGLVINPMEGYLHYAYTATGAAPVITIEDFDFETGTTAIKTLNAETMKAYSVDGWYTLNGVKLQGVPTEKGVYINNGKKVVIK